MAFNFSIGSAPVAKTSKNLKPWGIYDVTFDGFVVREFTSKAGNACKVFDIKFKGEAGEATITKFWPTDKDAERRSFDGSNGGKRYVASNFEQLMEILKQTVYALSPKGFEKLQEASKKFKSFDDVAKAVDIILKKCVGQTIQIKLGGYVNKSGYPTIDIPSLLYVEDAEKPASTSSIWIGQGLNFSDYEEAQKTKYEGAKPSNPEKAKPVETPIATETSESNDNGVDWNLDSLEDLESL